MPRIPCASGIAAMAHNGKFHLVPFPIPKDFMATSLECAFLFAPMSLGFLRYESTTSDCSSVTCMMLRRVTTYIMHIGMPGGFNVVFAKIPLF